MVAIVVVCMIAVPVLLYFLWVFVSDGSTPVKRVIIKLLNVFVGIVVIAAIVLCIYSVIPKEPTNWEKFQQLYEDVGPDGILEYLQHHLDREDILMILYPELDR